MGTVPLTRISCAPISFDPVHNAYRVLGERVGSAFRDGNALK